MSGTSLDGLDIVLCRFDYQSGRWEYNLLKAQTVGYPSDWKMLLADAPELSGRALMQLHRDYGRWTGEVVLDFLSDCADRPDFIASHGHTVFHEPHKQLNFQLGDGAMIAAITGLTTLSDFRSLDICLNGQGAPLVPIGDDLLFHDYAACVNIGGFANVSCCREGRRIAWDICPVNFVINHLVAAKGMSMDRNGELGAGGRILPDLLAALNSLNYYYVAAPKSLGQEWVDGIFWPLIKPYAAHPLPDILRTLYEHFSDVMSFDLQPFTEDDRILFTGGGVYNTFLMQLLQTKLRASMVVPNAELVEYKEAIVFAFLGVLRHRREVNCLQGVTGASDNSCSGGEIVRG